MTTAKFYAFGDRDDFDAFNSSLSEGIQERFLSDYPEAKAAAAYDEEEEILSISFSVDEEGIEGVDTLLCEEICHENELYCEISDGSSTKSYYFDEEDEWSYR